MEFSSDNVTLEDLSLIPQEEIFEYYGVEVVSGTFLSPFRDDNRPTCSFYYAHNGRLRLHDWAGYFHGDCLDLVQWKFNCSFQDALNIIANDFDLGGYTERPVQREFIPNGNTPSILQVARREWTLRDLRYWANWDISINTLHFFEVAPIDVGWLNGRIVYEYKPTVKPAFVYHFGKARYKFYFPYKRTKRFLHTHADILQGYNQLPDTGQYLIVTKSLKDVMKLYEMGLPAVAPMSEAQVLTNEQFNELSRRFKVLVALYDNDRRGMRSLLKFKAMGVIPLCIHKSYGAKDFTDFYAKYGRATTLHFINHLKAKLLCEK